MNSQFALPPLSDFSILSFDEQRLKQCADAWLDHRGFMRLLPASVFHAEAIQTVQAFATLHARYVIPTVELIAWLENQIAGRAAIEICAGQGDLGIHLGIRMTDSYQQLIPTFRDYYRRIGQAITIPPPEVREMDAVKAIRKYKPRVVIGGFVTHRHMPGAVNGNEQGPIEEEILANCETYIMIGNEQTHAAKPILKLPHQTYKFPWLVTRARAPEANAIFVWQGDL